MPCDTSTTLVSAPPLITLTVFPPLTHVFEASIPMEVAETTSNPTHEASAPLELTKTSIAPTATLCRHVVLLKGLALDIDHLYGNL